MSRLLDRAGAELASVPGGLTLEGTVTVAVAAELKEAARRSLAAPEDVRVSCAGLEQVDASVVQVLLALQRELAGSGRRLELRDVPPQIARSFALSGLIPWADPGGVA